MPLSEEAFTALVDAGCDGCGAKKLTVLAIVAEKVPLLNGEIFGDPSWGYKGEDLVRGTYRVVCNACKKDLFLSTSCPHCGAAGGIERALEGENAFLLPRACAGCGSRQLSALALVPARIDVAEKNKATGSDAEASAQLDLSGYDRCDPAVLNGILWHICKPGEPLPPPVRSIHWSQ